MLGLPAERPVPVYGQGGADPAGEAGCAAPCLRNWQPLQGRGKRNPLEPGGRTSFVRGLRFPRAKRSPALHCLTQAGETRGAHLLFAAAPHLTGWSGGQWDRPRWGAVCPSAPASIPPPALGTVASLGRVVCAEGVPVRGGGGCGPGLRGREAPGPGEALTQCPRGEGASLGSRAEEVRRAACLTGGRRRAASRRLSRRGGARFAEPGRGRVAAAFGRGPEGVPGALRSVATGAATGAGVRELACPRRRRPPCSCGGMRAIRVRDGSPQGHDRRCLPGVMRSATARPAGERPKTV